MNTIKPKLRIAVIIATLASSVPGLSAGERQDSLQAALKGADRVTVIDVEPGRQAEPNKRFDFGEADKIAELVSSLDFDDDESGFRCMCLGDATVTFFRGGEKIAELSHHHGHSLRWNGGTWDGDSLFTEKAARAWREWFNAQGEARFEKMHQQALAEAEREREIHDRFLRAFRPEAREIFEAAAGQDGWTTFLPGGSSRADEGGISRPARNLIALYPDRKGLATALAGALGSLTMIGAQEGSWTVSTAREQLALECAKTLKAEDFLETLGSEDGEVLAGAARLFFFEGLSRLLPEDQRARYAAKLVRVAIQRDKCGNADMAVRALGGFRSPETITLLEELAAGTIRREDGGSDHKDEPSPSSAACLLLARFGSEKVGELAKAVEQAGGLDEIDQAALRIARSFAGERGLLDRSVFEIDSYTVGFGALAALEREGGKAALDAVIMGGTTHSWAAIREEAVLATERMTGRKWFQNQGHERAEWHGKEIREWWQKNRESYTPNQ
jgi:hypothetical protein